MNLIKPGILINLCVAFILIFESCSTSVTGPVNLVGDPEKFKEYLISDQFMVRDGELTKVDLFQLVDNGIFQTCLGNNASAPYMACKLPPAPGQTTPNPLTEASGRSMEYRLRPDEAIVFVLKTPPPAEYFSYQSFLSAVDAGGARKRVFVALGDTYNNYNISTDATPNGKAGAPYRSNTIIIVTADKGIDAKMRDAAKAAGYSEAIMNTEIIPSSELALGIEPDKDTFHFLHRNNLFKNPEDGLNYVQNSPGYVWRVTPSKSITRNLFPPPALKQRGTGTTESLLSGSMNDLRNAILSKYSNLNSKELSTDIWFKLEDSDQIQRETNVLGVTRDALYLATDSFLLSDKKDDFIIAYGINHTLTGKSRYNNIVVYGRRLLNGVSSIFNYQLQGSAADYLPNHPDKDKMYAWKFTRSSVDTIHSTAVPYGIKSRGIELADSAFVIFRLYAEPQTNIGPNPKEVLFDRIIKFEPKGN